ncbi:MAG: copper-translocating P-type ATPase [Deinococcales bacterium]
MAETEQAPSAGDRHEAGSRGHEHAHGHDEHAPSEHGGSEHGGHGGDHGRHAGHSPAMFRDRLLVSVVLTLPILYFSSQLQSWLGYAAASFPGSGWVNPVLGTALFLYGGAPFLRGARSELGQRQPAMMTLIGLAITVAYGFSLAVSLGLAGRPFYWELATLIDVMLLGHWLEMASVQGASRALDELGELVPESAHRLLDGGRTEDVPVDRIEEGDRLLVRPGEQVPLDAEVEDGRSSVDEAFLTGESRPVPKQQGDEVVGGSLNGDGALTVRVSRTGDATTLRQILRLVEEAQASRSRYQGLADRAAGWLAYVAVSAGLLTLIVWLLLGKDFNGALTLMVTVLVIACPHALGLAIPLVTVNATSLSARNGILVRNREAFERARNLTFVAFDKTGTLTEGRFEVTRVATAYVDEDEAYRLAGGLEARSEHPLAKAVVEGAGERDLATVEDFEVEAGRGVQGVIDGHGYRIGRPEWVDESGAELPDALATALEEADGRGESTVVLMDDRRAVAVFALGDKVRPSAKEAVARLRKAGVTPVMITGDAEAVAGAVSSELGIERTFARVLPGDKAERIRELKRQGPTAFVGDGINDAPALLEADLGVAIGAGTHVAIESADLVLVENDPLDVTRALRLSRATYGKMVQNLFWATGYNAVAIPLAAGVLAPVGILLSPAVGALLMSLSTVIVAANAMLLRRVSLA